MEFVDGTPIDVFCQENKLSIRARVELFQQVARAVAYAHGRLIVHRDLKPSNILVTRQGEVRLLDFGAAKLLRDGGAKDSALTREAGRALSPDYASPEQIRGELITAASDVYSMGIVLFELLTQRRPYGLRGQTIAALDAAIGAAEVPLPSSTVQAPGIRREIRGDLDNIVTKALKKSPQERYGTVSDFADDLRRWLDHEPIRARPDGLVYRARKLVRRNRVVMAAGALVFVALTIAATVTTFELFEARKQRDEARAQAKRAEVQERFANMMMGQFGPGGRPLTREEMIDRSVELLDQQFSDDPRFIANALIPISGRYMDLGNTAKELAVLQKAESIARRLGDPVLLLNVQCNTVETELARGRIDLAERRMSEARSLLASTREVPPTRRIDCIHADATLADARGDKNAAVERIEAAIALQEQGDRTDSTYRALLSHAQVLYLHAGRPKDAYAVVEKTLAVLQETDAKNDEARSGALHNQSVALYQMGEVSDALTAERASITLSAGDDGDNAVAPLTSMVFARLLTRLNFRSDGEAWASRAVADARIGGNVSALLFALAALAEAKEASGHVEEASRAAAEASKLLSPTSDPRERAAVEHARALVALKRQDLGDAQAAAKSLLEAIGYPDKSRVRAAQSADVYMLTAAQIAMEAGQTRYAARLAADALELSNNLARNPQVSATAGEARLRLAQALYAQKDYSSARAALRGATRALESGLSPDHPITIEATTLAALL
jgi:serine/threonine-protein kinase